MTDFETGKLCERIVNQAPDAILFADNRGIIRLWNQGAERIFGWPAAEALGQPLDLIIPEKLRGRHGEGFARVMASGISKYGTDLLSVPATHKDGHRLSVDFCIVMLKDDQGRVEGVAAIMRDMSAQRQKEKALKERVAELEER
ncbi:PAS domain-containing protein [Geothermobacter hydrogeniphilus]|uniref:Histidine kinase n=1 Tax=Geothermobacter hydrogeniphilus TaxID=1969733 RepID=A0A1X0XN04_9BACT|nr:PAS domain S-box protein [Geothermobacter hydrogeniphilus]ORJ54289.1 histidine kinase [Geothermobacter hydrogeniphilus]